MTDENQIDTLGDGIRVMGNMAWGEHNASYQGSFLSESRSPPKPGPWMLRLQRTRRGLARPIWWLARRVEGPQWRDPLDMIWKE